MRENDQCCGLVMYTCEFVSLCHCPSSQESALRIPLTMVVCADRDQDSNAHRDKSPSRL